MGLVGSVQHCLQLGSALPWVGDAHQRILAVSEVFPYCRSPASLPIRVHSAMSSTPLQSLHRLYSTAQPVGVGKPTSPGVSTPFNGIHDQAPAPNAAGIAHPNRGSALRISHPFSGFREIVFHGLVSCRNRSWTVSLLSVPPVRVGGTFRHPIACSLAVIHQRAKTRHSRPYHLRFQSTAAFERRSLTSPEDYELPFHRPKPTSRSPWTTSSGIVSYRKLHQLRSFYPLTDPFASRPSKPERNGRYSPGFCLPL